MSTGLKIRRGNVVVFDSRIAAGGICLDIIEISGAVIVRSFPLMPRGRTPMVVYSDGATPSNWSYDELSGVPRFSFPATGTASSQNRTFAGIYLK